MTRARRFVYHPDNDPKMVYEEDAQEWYDKGWVDTPAKFTGVLEKFEVDPKDQAGVQVIGEAIAGVVKASNDALNLDNMKAGQLSKYLNENYGMDTSFRQGREYLLGLAKEKLEGSKIIDLGETVIGEDDDSTAIN